MTTWTTDELTTISAEDELQIAPQRGDGTLTRPRTVWVVRHGDALYVRSVNGRTSAWFRSTQARHQGHILSGGVEKDVTFEDIDGDGDVNDQIDAAYRSKYHGYPKGTIDTIITPQARSSTLKLQPLS
jgi:hypothetical protein